MLRLYAPSYAPRLCRPQRRLPELDLLEALFSPANWGRDIVSRETASLHSPIRRLEDGTAKMELYLDLHKFKPSEIAINTTTEGRLVVEAKSERGSEDGSFTSTSAIRREFPLPEGVKREELTAKVTEDGGLLLEAPVHEEKPKEGEAQNSQGETPLTIKHD